MRRSETREKVERLARLLRRAGIYFPQGGWIEAVRVEMGMSGAELARRARLSRSRVWQAEQDELRGTVTLRTMERLAEAMGCRFVYAITPDQPISHLVAEQVSRKMGELLSEEDRRRCSPWRNIETVGWSYIRALRDPWSSTKRGRPLKAKEGRN